jgi:ketosteroid isomerase-like protein
LTETPSPSELVDRFYGALQRGDIHAARACCSPDAVFWHNFDGKTQDLDQTFKGLRAMTERLAENRVVDVRRQELPGGLVQRHLFVMRMPGGPVVGKPCCIFVSAQDGLIIRLDEYVDIAANLPLPEGVEATPGLPPSTVI